MGSSIPLLLSFPSSLDTKPFVGVVVGVVVVMVVVVVVVVVVVITR